MKELNLAELIVTRMNSQYRSSRPTTELIQAIIDDCINVRGSGAFAIDYIEGEGVQSVTLDIRTNYYLSHYQADTMIKGHFDGWIKRVREWIDLKVTVSEFEELLKESWLDFVNKIFYYGYITTEHDNTSVRFDHFLLDLSNDIVIFSGEGNEENDTSN